MKHLNTEELLLIADGELSADRVGHLDACVECQESLGALQGELTMISSALTAPASGDTGSERSWARLETAISEVSETRDLHLTAEELLLLIDGDLTVGRAGHAKRCAGCGLAHADVQHLLWSVESELRAMAPSEPLERRIAAEQALKLHLYASKPKVIAFPARQTARYAAVAAALISVVAGGLLWNQTPLVDDAAVIAEASIEVPVLAAVAPIEPEFEAISLMADVENTAVAPLELSPVRFEFESARYALTPDVPAIIAALPAIGLTPATTEPFIFAALPSVSQPRVETLVALPAGASLAVLEARKWQLEAGLWREDIHPVWSEGGLAFAGTVESDDARQQYIAAIEQQAAGRSVDFDVTVRETANAVASRLGSDSSSAVGGLVRTALMDHYRDSARRSFQTIETSGLESEISRYVSEVFRSQNDLVGHAYQLDQLLNHSPESLSTGDAVAKTLIADLVRFHVDGMGRGEATIYDHLSEALPRRYWRYQGEKGKSLADAGDLGEESSALLRDVLGLERTLTVVLTGSEQTVTFAEAGTSSGEVLRRIHDRLDRIKHLTRTAL